MDVQALLCGLKAEGMNLLPHLPSMPRRPSLPNLPNLPRRPRIGLHPSRAVNQVRERVVKMTPKQLQRDRFRRHLPLGTGEYTVGCVDIMSGQTVNGVFIRLYYPTNPTDIYKREAQWPLWLPNKQYGNGYVYFRRKNTKVFGRILNWVGGDVYVPVLWQAPVLENRSSPGFPVVVFTHGLGGNRTTYTTVCSDLASHGYIVAALEHRDGSASMTYCFKEPLTNNNAGEGGDGSMEIQDITVSCDHIPSETYSSLAHWLVYDRQEDELDFNVRNKQVYKRVDEIQKVLNLLEAMNEGREVRNILGLHFDMRQFKGTMDLDRLAIAGHSFGGATTVAALALEPRFKCGVALDSWMKPLEDEIYERVRKPILLINTETFQWESNVQDMYKLDVNKSGDLSRLLLTIRGTCHQSQTDFQFMLPGKIARFMEMRHSLNSYEAMNLNNSATRTFLAKHLNIPDCDRQEELLRGEHRNLILGTNLNVIIPEE